MRRKNISDIKAMKGNTPIVCLTAYTALSARLMDPHVDILLVGDSLGMVLYGFESTLPVTLEMMKAHGAAVVRGSKQALVVVDLPFGSYQASKVHAFQAASEVMAATGAGAVKLEGGVEMADTVMHLTERGIPVVGHVGLQPQSVHRHGGYRVQGKDTDTARRILADAKAIASAGAFALVLEHIPPALGTQITKAVNIPTIGIGAGACDGQVLVSEDMSGFVSNPPSFVKQYANLGDALSKAAKHYAADVRAGKFPKA
ncbi:MAG: 3-methyl-2-oxobutanoate hydroxymethyltransferase [Proteobacteria bacterium]|nr:3-methyl-2-oxobutanoate hydroxymethyltransferase [Pseudomonadota bacterium]